MALWHLILRRDSRSLIPRLWGLCFLTSSTTISMKMQTLRTTTMRKKRPSIAVFRKDYLLMDTIRQNTPITNVVVHPTANNTCPFGTNVAAVNNVGKGVLQLDAGVPVPRPHLQPPGSVGLCLLSLQGVHHGKF